MRFLHQRFLSVVCAAVLGASPGMAQDYQEQVTSAYFTGEIAGHGMINPVLRYSWHVTEQSGRLAVCGITHLRDAGVRSTIRRMSRNATFYLNEQIFDIDVSYFTEARNSEQLRTGTATCRVTEIPAAAGGGTVGLSYGSGTHRD